MQIWGSFALHPMTFPVADQVASLIVLGCKYSLVLYGAVLKPTVEEFHFLLEHLN